MAYDRLAAPKALVIVVGEYFFDEPGTSDQVQRRL